MVGPPGCFWVGVQLGAGLVGEQAALGFGKLIRVQEWSWERGRICIKSIYIMLFTNYTSQEAAGWQKGMGTVSGTECREMPDEGKSLRAQHLTALVTAVTLSRRERCSQDAFPLCHYHPILSPEQLG